jgi:hypothetical protein
MDAEYICRACNAPLDVSSAEEMETPSLSQENCYISAAEARNRKGSHTPDKRDGTVKVHTPDKRDEAGDDLAATPSGTKDISLSPPNLKLPPGEFNQVRHHAVLAHGMAVLDNGGRSGRIGRRIPSDARVICCAACRASSRTT